jgi:hypothetical protein
VAVAALVSTPSRARGADDREARFEKAAAALEKNDTAAALLELEALADRGVLHPDVAYSRGLAYAMRARSEAAEPGDLGRAAQGFEEALRMRPGDRDAERALDLVHAEVARRRARMDKNDTIVRPSLDRVLVTTLSPVTWTILAVVASLLLGFGLLARKREARVVRIAGRLLVPVSILALAGLVPAAALSRSLSETRREGVVVVPEIGMRDDDGQPTQAPDIPEATLLEVGERKDDVLLVRWGSYEGWVPAESVRVIARIDPSGA